MNSMPRHPANWPMPWPMRSPKPECSRCPGKCHDPHTVSGNEATGQGSRPCDGAKLHALDWHHFPDGESLMTLRGDLDGADVALLATLRDPDRLALPLRFAAATAREMGARRVGLIAPYLGYMRQDRRFRAGQSVSAPLFAQFLGQSFDGLVTVDPHLHRISRLEEV